MEFIIDFILHIDRYMIEIVQDYHLWTYAILFLIIFCETGLVVTPFLPGDSLLFVSGAIAAQPDVPLSVNLLALILFAAAALGDSCNYEIGRFFGHKLPHIQARISGENPRFLSEIRRKDHRYRPFCSHRAHAGTFCSRNGENALLLFYCI